MFEIKYSNGSFVYPNEKMYIGIVELEITNGTYFNINEKEYTFETEESFRLKIASMCDANINSSKKMRITTFPFEDQSEAINAIEIYLDSIRMLLLKRGFSYRMPLVCKSEEISGAHDCVAEVEIILLNNEKISINEKERLHNEGDSWYRIYSKQDIPICETTSLCVETSAHENAEDARQSLDAIRPMLKAFLKSNTINTYEISETGIKIYASAHLCMRVESSVTLSTRVPFNATSLQPVSGDAILCAVLSLLEHKGFQDLPNLYNILELIEKDMGEKNQNENLVKIERLGLATKKDIEKFTYSVNRVNVVGIKNVRHGAKISGAPSPKKAISVDDCRKIMKDLIDNWFDHKMKSKNIISQ